VEDCSDVVGPLAELSTVTSAKGRGIKEELQKMYNDSRMTRFSMEVPQLWVMHERILFCYQSNHDRARCLNILGDILLQSYQASGNVDDLNQAVCAYNDACGMTQGTSSFVQILESPCDIALSGLVACWISTDLS
jgi:hypothetical protein